MDQVSNVREKIDLVGLVSEYLPLKKAGRNFKTNCPFHNEKTASLVVSPERQIWHCFGCGKGGDAFTFLMEYERMEFGEALRMLASRAGVQLENYKGTPGVATKKEKLYEINRSVLAYYQYVLTNLSAGKRALEYLISERGVKPATIQTFQLGYAPESGGALVSYLVKKKKYTRDDLFEAGLVTMRNGRMVDFFQSRIIFPLIDHRDNVVGFSGRIFLTDEKTAKYINTRETLIYHKGSTFFNLNLARESIRKSGQAIVMEGELDVIASYQEGITNAVAVKGTALTMEQVNLLGRYATKVTLCFDMDSAGQEAVKRSLPILETKGLRTTVIVFPSGKDADEEIKRDVGEFKRAVKNDIDIYDYLLARALEENDRKTAEGKRKIGDELLPIFGYIENEIVKEHFLTKLSREIDTSYQSLLRQIERVNKKEIVRQKPIDANGQAKTREEVLEEYLLAMLVQSDLPIKLLRAIHEMISIYKFKMPVFQKLYEFLYQFTQKNETFEANEFAAQIPAELRPAFDECFLLPITKFSNEQTILSEVEKVASELHGIYVREQIKQVGELIAKADESNEEMESLRGELNRWVGMLRKK